MRNEIKKNLQWYLRLVLVLLIPVASGSTNPPVIEITCSAPQASVTNQSSSSVSFGWSAVSGATEYVVFYTREEDNYTSQPVQTSNTSITFSGLPAGTYDFHFATKCGTELSDIIIILDIIMG